MGAVFQQLTVDSKDTKKVIAAVNAYIDECQYDFGHAGYTGTFAEVPGVSFPKDAPTFKSVEAASEWLENHAEKWENALAVKFAKGYVVGALVSE